MVPAWLTVVAWLYLSACFCWAGIIGYDIAVNRRRQAMGVMNVVFPVTALYFGPLALAFYWRWGRAAARTAMPPMPRSPAGRRRPWWVTIAIEVSHCGSGCVLGDVISEFAIFALGLAIAGLTLAAEYIGDRPA